MDRFEHFLTALVDELPLSASEPDSQLALAVREVHVEVPIESRLDDALHAVAPRGRMATGFDSPLGRVRASFWRTGS